MEARLTCATSRGCWPLCVVTLVCVCLLLAHDTAQAQKTTFRLQSAQGQVQIQARGQGPWTALKRGTRTAAPGDRVRTGANGSVHIVLGDGQRVALGPNTEVVLREPDKPRGWRVVVGKVLSFITGRQRLEVRAPAAIAAAEGTVFQLEVSADGTTVLTVVSGLVRFFNELGSVTVLTAQQSTARVGEAPTRPIVVDPSGLIAWEANLQTIIIEVEAPQVSTDPDQLQQELTTRQQAVQQAPQDAAARAALAQVLLDLGRTDEAEAEARQAVQLAPGAAASRGALGFVLVQAGRPAEARAEFDQAAQAEPNSARWQLGLGLVAMGQRDVQPALAPLQRAAQLAPTDPLPQAYLAAAQLRLGDLAAADTAASAAVRLGPTNHLASVYLAYVRLAQGQVDEAVSAGAAAVEAAPGSALAHEALGTAQFFAGDFPEARQQLDAALELNPLSASAHLAMAKLLAAEDDVSGAVDEARLAVSLNPQSAPARSTLGLLFLLDNDPQRAGRQFEQALALDPNLSEARTGWGMVLAKRGRFKEALAQQEAAVSLDTDSASAQNNLGAVHAAAGRMKLAIEHLERAIELQPGWGTPYANLALVHLEQNRFREALDAGERAVELGERSAFIHTVLGRIYLSQGRTDRAVAQFREAVAVDETYPQAHFQLSRIYLQQDRARDAVREIMGSVTTDPSAMLETRRYARTENTIAGGRYGSLHYDARHSDEAAEGRFSYFASGLVEYSDGWRAVNQNHDEQFLELVAGHQPDADQQLVLFGTYFNRDASLPGPVRPGLLGDVDDQQSFDGYDAVLAYRHRLSPTSSATVKYSYRRKLFHFRNPDSMTGTDTNPFPDLVSDEIEHSPEIRVEANPSGKCSLRAGWSHLCEDRELHGTVGILDPITNILTFTPFGAERRPDTDTIWFEAQTRPSDKFHLLGGGVWGRETGHDFIFLPKAVATYRPDRRTWLSFLAIPIFRADIAELAPVEALADPRGLRYLDFVEGGAGRSYELRFQRITGRSSALTASVAHQRVRGLLVDVQDPAWTGLPARVLVGQGHRWVADAAYERWLCDNLTGRLSVRWQDSEGKFPPAALSGTQWPYTPEWQARGRLDYIDENGWRIGLEGIWVDERFHDPQNTIRVGGYPMVNLSVQFQRNLHENYFLNVVNLTGCDYQTFAGFPQPRGAVFGGVEYRF
ncbi:MAG: TonB-dependent receptor domain-containing protein [Armatimonadota bacterium]